MGYEESRNTTGIHGYTADELCAELAQLGDDFFDEIFCLFLTKI